MRRTREEALETRDRILDSAEQVFLDKGVAAATLQDIAKAAAVTRGAIYGHFENKQAVFQAMVARVKLPLDELVDAAGAPSATQPIDLLHAALAAFLREVAEEPRTRRVFRILLTHREVGPAEWLRDRYGAAGAAARLRLGRVLHRAQQQGELPPDLDVERAAALLRATLGGVLHEWLLDPGAIALPADADRLAQAMLDMLRLSPAMRRSA
jgi:TetR/AcrR family acrAB operon transcriptional repressor